MNKRKSESQWIELVKEFKSSGLKLVAWCREKQISKSSIYPYIKKYNNQVESADQEWGVVPIPNSIEKSPISLKIGSITLDIRSFKCGNEVMLNLSNSNQVYLAYTEVLIILKFIGAFGVFSLFV